MIQGVDLGPEAHQDSLLGAYYFVSRIEGPAASLWSIVPLIKPQCYLCSAERHYATQGPQFDVINA